MGTAKNMVNFLGKTMKSWRLDLTCEAETVKELPIKRCIFQECIDNGFVPSWLTRGRISLLQKDKSKNNVASNYRPITCLPLMWKLLTGVIADQIYAHLDQEKLLPEEQKGCREGSRGTNDLLYIDRTVDYRMFRFVWSSREY